MAVCSVLVIFMISAMIVIFGRTEDETGEIAGLRNYEKYIKYEKVSDEITNRYESDLRPEGYSENILTGLALSIEENKSAPDTVYRVFINVRPFEEKYYDGISTETEKEIFKEWAEKSVIDKEKLQSEIERFKAEKTDNIYGQNLKIILRYSTGMLAEWVYSAELSAETVYELANEGYEIGLIGEGKNKDTTDDFNVFSLREAADGKTKVLLSVTAETEEDGIKKTKKILKSAGIEEERIEDEIAFTERIAEGKAYLTADCVLEINKEEAEKILSHGGTYLKITEPSRKQIKEWAEKVYKTYGDGYFESERYVGTGEKNE